MRPPTPEEEEEDEDAASTGTASVVVSDDEVNEAPLSKNITVKRGKKGKKVLSPPIVDDEEDGDDDDDDDLLVQSLAVSIPDQPIQPDKDAPPAQPARTTGHHGCEPRSQQQTGPLWNMQSRMPYRTCRENWKALPAVQWWVTASTSTQRPPHSSTCT